MSMSWLIDVYCVIFDVLSPAAGFSVAVSSAVLILMYRDIADTITVRVSGIIGFVDACFQIFYLIIRALASRPELQHDNAAARIFTFITHFCPLLITFLTTRIAFDLQVNFLGMFSTSKIVKLVMRRYVTVSVLAAFALAFPLFFAPSTFDPELYFVRWSFGGVINDVLYVILGFYMWIFILLVNFVVVIIKVVSRLRREPPSDHNLANSLSAGVMRDLEHHMRRKARILVLYPLGPLIFYTPILMPYIVQAFQVKDLSVGQALRIVSFIIAPLQPIYDMVVFAMLPPVQRVMRWYWVLHKDEVGTPLFNTSNRESIFVGPARNDALTDEEAWVQEVSEPHVRSE